MLSVAGTPENCPSSIPEDSTAQPRISTSHSGNSPTTPEEPQHSQAYQAFLNGCPAEVIWNVMTDAERLEVLYTQTPAPEWYQCQRLDVLARLWGNPVLRGEIKARFTAIKGNPWDLEQAIKSLLPLAPPARPLQDTQPVPAGPARAAFHAITAAELYAKELPEIPYVVEEILPVGATLFVGKAKDGKSLAMWNLCIAVAEGGLVFGKYRALQGDALYLALEDGERRAKKRLTDQMRASDMTAPPARLSLVVWDAPRLGEGLEEALTDWLAAHPDAKLIVVDILEKIRPRRAKHGSVYQEDYLALAPLQRLAQDRGIALVVVHHANKAKADDFRDAISGSTSLAGAADTLWVLKRLGGEADASLQITGRDIEGCELALQFQHGFWTAIGDAEDFRLSQASREVLELLTAAGKPMTPKQLATALGIQDAIMRVRLSRMAERGEVRNLGEGRYIPGTPSAPPMPTGGAIPVTHVMPDTPRMPDTPVADVAPARIIPLMTGAQTPTGVSVTPVTLLTPITRVTGVTGGATKNGTGDYGRLANGSANGTVSHEAASAPDTVCPQCAKKACQPYGVNGRVCMQCGYCERPRPA